MEHFDLESLLHLRNHVVPHDTRAPVVALSGVHVRGDRVRSPDTGILRAVAHSHEVAARKQRAEV